MHRATTPPNAAATLWPCTAPWRVDRARHPYHRLLLPALAALAFASACIPSRSVPRVVQGRTVIGRRIEAGAYAAYTRGAYHEQRGEREAALSAYREALRVDPDSAAIWTRIGALTCEAHADDARDAFAKAVALDAEYAPAWAERARCEHTHDEPDAALAAARRAIALDASNTLANVVVARVYGATGRGQLAKSWLFALVLRSPEPNAHWTELALAARAAGDLALAAHAEAELARRRAHWDTAPHSREPKAPPSPTLHAALGAGDLERLRTLAAEAHLSPRALALLLAAHGFDAAAQQQAELVLDANPRDADAWIASVVAAAPDPERLAALLSRARATPSPEPLGAEAFADLLAAFVGTEAAQAWRRAYFGP